VLIGVAAGAEASTAAEDETTKEMKQLIVTLSLYRKLQTQQYCWQWCSSTLNWIQQ